MTAPFEPRPVVIQASDRLAWHRQLNHDQGLSLTDLRLALTISEHINKYTSECFLGMETLAGEAGMNCRTAERSRKKLVKRGHLRVKQGGGAGLSNLYAMIIRDPYPLTKNPGVATGVYNLVSDQKPRSPTTKNPGLGTGPTLKDNSKKESEGFSMNQEDNPATAELNPGWWRIGANGYALLKPGSPPWFAWFCYYLATNPDRADLMAHQADNGRHGGEWQEPTPWPPYNPTMQVAAE